MRRTTLRLAPIVTLLVIFVFGGSGVLPLSSPVEAQGRQGGKLVFAARQDIDTLDPHITNRAATRKILIQFTDTLTVITG